MGHNELRYLKAELRKEVCKGVLLETDVRKTLKRLPSSIVTIAENACGCVQRGFYNILRGCFDPN